jgi:hypothetical protein
MKAINYIYDKFNERGMKAFEKKVEKLLKVNGIDKDVICHNAYMKRGGGHGSYYRCIEIEVDNNREAIEICEHTNDSQSWDAWHEPAGKDKRNLFLAVLENKIDELKEYLTENI